MIKSMTGFGRCEVADGERKFTVEMKSVNHRYLDAEHPDAQEAKFFRDILSGTILKKSVHRGKVDYVYHL